MPIKYKVQQQILCLVVGVPASGKSSLAQKLAKEVVNGTYISKDLIQSSFTTGRVTGKTYSMIQRPTFSILVSYADTQLKLNKIPIIDAPFSINHWRKDEYSDWVSPFKKVAEKYNARLVIIRCVPPSISELRKRIEKRGCVWDEWKLKNWDEFLKREPINFPIPHDDVYEVVSDKPVECIVRNILTNYIQTKGL